MKVHDLSILTRFRFIFLLILVSVTLSYGLVLHFNNQQKTEGALIDVAGRNRMLSQRMAAMAMMADTDKKEVAEKCKEEMRKAMVLHDQSIQALKNGGLAPGMTDIEFEPASPLVLPRIKELEEFFAGQKQIVQSLLQEPREISVTDSAGRVTLLRNEKYTAAMDALKQQLLNGTLLALNIELTQLYGQQASSSKTTFITLLIFLFLVNVAVLGFAFQYLKQSISPLGSLTRVISRLAEGELPDESAVKGNDEIGKITNAVNVLSTQLKSATGFARDVGEGHLDTEITMFNGKGDLSISLQGMRQNLKKVAVDERKRNWTTEGLAKFADILRSTTDPVLLAENVIRNLVKYLNANQGSVFIAADEGSSEKLSLAACYAFNRKKFLQKSIMPGEGLAGQAYLEKETIYVKRVPQDYVLITSGLGEANPAEVLIVPLKVNDCIEGVIELASFNEFQDFEIGFVERLAENIASAISSVKINARTKQLLEASQQQAEELRSQEEEMRQNMEELAATQEEMTRKEQEYITRIAELETRVGASEVRPASFLN